MKFLILVLSLLTCTWLCSAQTNVIFNDDNSNFSNPERGFYRHTETHSNNYTALNPTVLSGYRDDGITLILRVFYLEDFKEGTISNSYLDMMRKDFNEARKAGVKVIVRFAYTQKSTAPYGDASLENVLVHIDQLKPILSDNADVITLVQAGFIGAWGEWYYTDHFSTVLGSPNEDDWVKRRQLVDALLEAMPAKRMVQARTPSIKTTLLQNNVALTAGEAFNGTKKARLAHHNDCFLASANDVGTYINIEAEKAYLEEETNFLAMGGETCGVADPYSLCPNALVELERFHWSYLNIDYHPAVLDSWRGDGCFSEVERNLGYRYRLLDATASTIGKAGSEYLIKINLLNDGWANVYNQRNLEIVLKNQSTDTEYFFRTNEDMRFWSFEDTTTISLTLGIPENMEQGDYSVYVNMPDYEASLYGDPNYSVRFANVGVWEPELGYNNLGITLNIADANTANNYVGTDVFMQRTEPTLNAAAITIDGNPSDWDNVPAIFFSGTNAIAQSIKMYNDGDSLYMLVSGQNLHDTYQLFFDLDKSSSSGYQAWQWANNGAELLVENGIFYSYNGVANAWGWTLEGSTSSQKNDSTIELSLALTALNEPLTFNFAFVNDPANTTMVNYLPLQNESFLMFNLLLSSNTELLSGSGKDRIMLFWGKTDDVFTRIVERSTNDGVYEAIAALPGSADYHIDFITNSSATYQYRYYLTNEINISPYSSIVNETLTDDRGNFYNFQIDGDDADWFAVPPLTTQTFASAYTLRTFWGTQNAHFILSGSPIDNYAIYLDTDNNEATGGQVTPANSITGFDFLLYKDSLFQYNAGDWEYAEQKLEVATTNSYLEFSVGLNKFSNLGDNLQINIAALYRVGFDTVFLPDKNEKAAHIRILPSTTPTAFNVRKSGSLPKSRLVVSWDKCENCNGYILERSLSPTTDFVEIGDYDPATVLMTDDGLTDETTYYYRMYSYTEIGVSAFTEIASESTGEIVLGVENNELNGIQLYPNPARNNLFIESINNSGIFQLQLYSIWGTKIRVLEVDLSNNQVSVPLHDLKDGVYVVVLIGKQNTYRLKFLKSNSR